jgi:hypothetical protein
MRRLSSEYNWEMTEEDGATWAEFACQYEVDLFVAGVAAHMADQTMTSLGTPSCTFRPKVGQIAGHIDRIVEGKRGQSSMAADKAKYAEWKQNAASEEIVTGHMDTIREQFPTMFRKGVVDE